MIQLGYDSDGVTYLKARTSTGLEFSSGRLKSTDSSTFQYFTSENPLYGIQGYETSTIVKALGFVRYNCTGVAPESLIDDVEEDTETSSSGLTDPELTAVTTSSTAVALIMVSILLTILGMCCLGCLCFFMMHKCQ